MRRPFRSFKTPSKNTIIQLKSTKSDVILLICLTENLSDDISLFKNVALHLSSKNKQFFATASVYQILIQNIEKYLKFESANVF